MSKIPYEVYTEEVEALSVLSPDGEIVNKDKLPELSDDQLKELMYRMVFTRTWDERAINLGRQGRLGFYAPVSGQEATMVGSEFALEKTISSARATAICRSSYGTVFRCIKLSCIPAAISMADKFRKASTYLCLKSLSARKFCMPWASRWATN
ncbi:hypothetical protein HMSSN036_15580 [Paenibacillus macerans]|nr:hypothetical protein HMSSN036_15580 [Paenibacillus macerans]